MPEAQECVPLFEKLRPKQTTDEEKRKLVADIVKKVGEIVE